MDYFNVDLNDIKEEVIIEDSMTPNFDNISKERLKNAIINVKDPLLPIKVEPGMVDSHQIKKEGPDQHGERAIYPIDVSVTQVSLLKSNDSGQSLSNAECSRVDETVMLKIKSEEINLDLKSEAERLSEISFSAAENPNPDMTCVVREIKTMDIDLNPTPKENLKQEDPSGTSTKLSAQLTPLQASWETSKNQQLLSVQSVSGILQCTICEYQCKNQIYFSRHIALHKICDDNGVLHCTQCEYITKRYFCLKSHMMCKHNYWAEIKVYSCNFCPYKTKIYRSLKMHVVSKHNKTFAKVKVFQCTQCKYKTKKNEYLKRHITHNHKTWDKVPMHTKIEESLSIKENMSKNFDKLGISQCGQCGFKTKHKLSLRQHIIFKHKSFDEVEIFHCAHCEFKTKHKVTLVPHIISKHRSLDEVEIFQCEECEYKTKIKARLKRHINFMHKSSDNVKHFQCLQCNFKTKYKASFNRHIILTHKSFDEVDIFKCTECEFKTKHKTHLKRHNSLRHTTFDEIKFFKCAQCEFKTKYDINLKRHTISKHKSFDEVKTFQCPQCEHKTKFKTNLNKHIITKHRIFDA